MAREVLVGPGQCIGLDDIVMAGFGRVSVAPSREALEAASAARGVYMEEASRRRVYGYCTGLGALQGASRSCTPEYEDVILDEHAAGVGPEAPRWLVRAFLAVWLAQASSGGHPLRPGILEHTAKALKADVTPVAPLYGSVGASGDLAPSAHVFRCILRGKGEAYLGGERLDCREALRKAGMEPLDLEVGEALAIINNTAWSTTLAAVASWVARRLISTSLRVASYTLESIPFNEEEFGLGAEAKRHPGQAEVSKRLRGLRPASKPARLQDPYSIRCIPQVYGAALEAVEWASELVEREACSPTTNPVVAGGRVWHTCNFHTAYVGLSAEVTSLALVSLINITYFRIERLLDSRINGASDFLAGEGSSVGAMIAQYTAASIAAEARASSFPRLAEWLPTSLGHEDSNPMSPSSALKALRLARSLSWLIAIEAVIASIIRRARGLEDPLGINANTRELAGSIERARNSILERDLLEILDNTP